MPLVVPESLLKQGLWRLQRSTAIWLFSTCPFNSFATCPVVRGSRPFYNLTRHKIDSCHSCSHSPLHRLCSLVTSSPPHPQLKCSNHSLGISTYVRFVHSLSATAQLVAHFESRPGQKHGNELAIIRACNWVMGPKIRSNRLSKGEGETYFRMGDL